MAGGPSAGTIWIQSPESSKGDSLDGGLSGMTESVRVGADGKFRICELRRGQYKLMGLIQEIGKPNDPPQFGTLGLTVTDRDAEKLQIIGTPGVPVTGRVMWEGAPPEAAPTVRALVSLQPANRINFQGEGGGSVRVAIPSDFSIPNVLVDEYRVRPFVNSRTIYVKDVYYGNTSILRDTFRVGSAGGTGELRVVLGHDAGSIAVKVADKDGNPMSDIHVVAAPVEIGSEAAFGLAYIIGDTDQDGMVTLTGLAPGKYHLLALTKKMNHSVDNISRMWAARSQAKVVDVAPNGNAQVTMEPSKVE